MTHRSSSQFTPILTIGDPRLRIKSDVVLAEDKELSDQIELLFLKLQEFRHKYGFGRAISAPQIGINKRLIVMNLGKGPFAIINPEITFRSLDMFDVWDNCMSLPGVSIKVTRHKAVNVRYQMRDFNYVEMHSLSEDDSELFQHEIDHLDGLLFTDRMISAKDIIATEHKKN